MLLCAIFWLKELAGFVAPLPPAARAMASASARDSSSSIDGDMSASTSTDHPHLGAIQQMHSAIRFTGEAPQMLSPAPALGSDTQAVLSELLGLSNSDIASLVEEEAILISD